jgi:hypothetical protein
MSDPLRAVLGGAAFDLLADWQRSTNRRIAVAGRSPLAGGKSGATLIPVHVTDGGTVRAAILKLCPATADGPAREPAAHDLALRVSPPEFVRDHLVERLYDPIVLPGGGALLFQRIAHGSLDEYATLAGAVRGPSLGAATRIITRGVLRDWNAPVGGNGVAVEMVGLDVFLRSLLDYRLDPGRPLQTWLASRPAISGSKGLFLRDEDFPGRMVNPIALLNGHRDVARFRVPLTTGRAHGDLHVDNVIAYRGLTVADAEQFILIDLSTFSESAPLVRDPLHLLLSVVARHLPDLRAPQRSALVEVLVERATRNPKQLPEPLVAAAEGLWDGGLDWYGPADRADDWHLERLLGLVACALMYVPRDHGADSEAARWYFTLAAKAATAYLSTTADGRRPRSRPSVTTPAPAPAEVPAAATAAIAAAATSRRRLALSERRDLATAMLKVPGLSHVENLRRVVEELPDPIPMMAPQDSAPWPYALQLVGLLESHAKSDPWPALIEAIGVWHGHPDELEDLEKLAAQLGLLDARAA